MGVEIVGDRYDFEAIDLARSYVPVINSAWAGHNECRKQAIDQIEAEVTRGLAQEPQTGGNALFIAMKELELAIHSSAMLQAVTALAQLAVAGVPLPVPLDELPTEEDTQQ
jgi:hypothetical protein